MRSIPARPALALASLLLGVGLAGCSASVSTTPSVDEAEVETQAEAALAPKLQGETLQIDCPGNLTAEVNATLTCAATVADQEIDALITVTSVDADGNVKFDVELQDGE